MCISVAFTSVNDHQPWYLSIHLLSLSRSLPSLPPSLPSLLVPRVVELTGDVTPDMRAIAAADLIVTTPEKWDGVSRSWQNRSYVQKVAILIIDEIHLLGNHSLVLPRSI